MDAAEVRVDIELAATCSVARPVVAVDEARIRGVDVHVAPLREKSSAYVTHVIII